MSRKGFTLIELLMVVIIIGILVTLAIPNYFQSVERTKGATAKSVMDNIRKAELQYRAVNGTFVDDSGSFPFLQAFDIPNILINNSGDDGDWTYNTTNADDDTVTMVATRNTNAPTVFDGVTITMDHDGTTAWEHNVYQN